VCEDVLVVYCKTRQSAAAAYYSEKKVESYVREALEGCVGGGSNLLFSQVSRATTNLVRSRDEGQLLTSSGVGASGKQRTPRSASLNRSISSAVAAVDEEDTRRRQQRRASPMPGMVAYGSGAEGAALSDSPTSDDPVPVIPELRREVREFSPLRLEFQLNARRQDFSHAKSRPWGAQPAHHTSRSSQPFCTELVRNAVRDLDEDMAALAIAQTPLLAARRDIFNGSSVFMSAATTNSPHAVDLCRFLYHCSGSAVIVGRDQWHPLHGAAKEGHPRTILYLLREGFDHKIRTDCGTRAIHYFCSRDRKALGCSKRLLFYLLHLLLRDIDVNDTTFKGETALHYACRGHASWETIKFLLDHGADPNMRTCATNSLSPMDMARLCNRDDMVERIVEYTNTLADQGTANGAEHGESRPPTHRQQSLPGELESQNDSTAPVVVSMHTSLQEEQPVSSGAEFAHDVARKKKYKSARSEKKGGATKPIPLVGRRNFVRALFDNDRTNSEICGLLLVHRRFLVTDYLRNRLKDKLAVSRRAVNIILLWMHHFGVEDFSPSSTFALFQFLASALKHSSGTYHRSMKAAVNNVMTLTRLRDEFDQTLVKFIEFDQGGARMDLIESGHAVEIIASDMELFVRHCTALQTCLHQIVQRYELLDGPHNEGCGEILAFGKKWTNAVVYSIIRCEPRPNEEERWTFAFAITTFIELAVKFLRIHNYATAKYVVDALTSLPVRRLTHAWLCIGEQARRELAALVRLFSKDRGGRYSRYEATVLVHKVAGIPFISPMDMLMEELQYVCPMLPNCQSCGLGCSVRELGEAYRLIQVYHHDEESSEGNWKKYISRLFIEPNMASLASSFGRINQSEAENLQTSVMVMPLSLETQDYTACPIPSRWRLAHPQLEPARTVIEEVTGRRIPYTDYFLMCRDISLGKLVGPSPDRWEYSEIERQLLHTASSSNVGPATLFSELIDLVERGYRGKAYSHTIRAGLGISTT